MLDLNNVRTSADARIFSGRDSGKAARVKLEVERVERADDKIIVRIPTDALAVNLSFFLGLFGPSVRKYGAEGFRDIYTFEGKPIHLRSVEEGIRKALIEGSIFD